MSTALRSRKAAGAAQGRFGTLLGPEGSGNRTSGPWPQGPVVDPTSMNHPRMRAGVGTRWVCRPYVENCTVDASIFGRTFGCVLQICGQVTKGTRWMPRHQEPMKDVGGCDKPRGAVNQAVIRGCPNGETQLESCPVTLA